MTPAYQRLIDRFLDNNTTLPGRGEIMYTAHAYDESERREVFMKQVINIYPDHWLRGTWLLNTHPVLVALFFEKGMKKALVFYTIVYETNIAVLRKKGDTWEIINAKRWLIQQHRIR